MKPFIPVLLQAFAVLISLFIFFYGVYESDINGLKTRIVKLEASSKFNSKVDDYQNTRLDNIVYFINKGILIPGTKKMIEENEQDKPKE